MAQLWRGALEAGGFMAPTTRYTVDTLKITNRIASAIVILYTFNSLNCS